MAPGAKVLDIRVISYYYKSMNLYRPVKIGPLELNGNLFIAPVAGYSDRSFRSLCVEQGACFSFTELVSAEALYRNPGLYGLDSSAAGRKTTRLPLLSA